MKLNLETKNKEQERIKEYLEANSSEILADKINNGVKISKDGKTLINKKDLDGFWRYATEEARKASEKGSNGAYVDDNTVFGWAIHYFEEDSIEGTLFNEDGTEYKKQIPKPAPTTTTPKPVIKEKPQGSLFDLLTTPKEEVKEESVDDEIFESEPEEEITYTAKPFYQRYCDIKKANSDYIVFYQLGDFLEVFGDDAKLLSEELDLTLTGRDVGLKERIPIIGIPFHTMDTYFNKLLLKHNLIWATEDEIRKFQKVLPEPLQDVDKDTGEIFVTNDELTDLYEIFGDNLEVML